MTEQRITQALRDAVADEPPLWLDVDEIATRARQQQRRSRALMGTVTATVLIAVSAITVPSLFEPVPEAPASRENASSDPFPRWAGLWPRSAGKEYSAQEYEKAAGIVRDRIATAFADHAPEVTVDLLAGNEGSYVTEGADQLWWYPVRFSTTTGTYEAVITVNQGDREEPPLACGSTEPPSECDRFSLPGEQGLGLFRTGVTSTFESRVEVVPFYRLSVVLSVSGSTTDLAPLPRSTMTDIALAIASQ